MESAIIKINIVDDFNPINPFNEKAPIVATPSMKVAPTNGRAIVDFRERISNFDVL